MAAAADVRTQMSALDGVGKVSEPVPSPKGTAVLVNVELTGEADTAEDRIQPLLDTTADVGRSYPDLRVEQVGGASLDKALSETLGQDFQKAELISIPVTLVIMLLVFGALIAAGRAGAARDVGRRHGARALRAGVAPDPRHRQHQQHDPADRHGGRRRLLVVLRPPRT